MFVELEDIKQAISENHENVETTVDAHIDKFTEKIPAIDAYAERIRTMTTEEVYWNYVYYNRTITVLNKETGLPIEGATI